MTASLAAANAAATGPSKTLIACLHEGRFRYFAHPTSCDFFARISDSRVRDIRARDLHWTDWGETQTTAEGHDSTGVGLSVIAFHPVRCGGPLTYYRFLRATRPSGRTYLLTLAKCGQPRFRPTDP